MPETAPSTSIAEPELETFRELVELARGKSRPLPEALLARHVLRTYATAGWPVQRAALEALLRRTASMRSQGLRATQRPPALFGMYRTGQTRSGDRPYATVLHRLEPLEGSCSCADFARAALGLCKHLLAVLAELGPKKGASERLPRVKPWPEQRSRLLWDSIRPLDGPGDWLAQVRWISGASKDDRASGVPREFQLVEGRVHDLRTVYAGDPVRRLRLVEELIALRRSENRRPHHADAALPGLLAEERDRLHDALALRQAQLSLRGSKLVRRLYPYQREGLARFTAGGRLLLGDEMGLGKTVQAIAACGTFFDAKRISRGLLVVPASLKPQWLREWHAFGGGPIELVDGTPAQRAASYASMRRGFLLVNYEQVIRDIESLRRWDPELVVLDEAQRIKNWATRTASTIKQLRPRYRLVLTGTPMENRLEELASIFEWVDDRALEPKWRLTPAHTIHVDGTQTIGGLQRLDTLRARLGPRFLRRRRAEVLGQLPPRTDIAVPIELTPRQIEEHDALFQPIWNLRRISLRRPLTQQEFLRLMQLLATQRIIANGIEQLRFPEVWPVLSANPRPSREDLERLDAPKLLELREIVQRIAIEQERKIVVFSQWRRMLQLAHWAVQGELAASGLRAAFFSGEEKQKRRTQNLVEFHDDPSLRVLFATDAGGIGLNLQRAATCCVNLELPWNPAVLEQRVSRIYRIGQEHPIDVYNLIGTPSLEMRIADLVSSKKAAFEGLFDGTSDELRFERSGSFLQKLDRLLETSGDADLASSESASEEESEILVERELEAVLAEADEAGDAPSLPAVAAAAALPDPTALRELMSELRVEATPAGGMRIEASPRAASSLAALFEGLGALLRRAEQEQRPS